MIAAQHRDPSFKKLLRLAWRGVLLAKTLLAYPLANAKGGPRVFYGGARSGDMGGPLVKVKRLQAFFPEYQWSYNIVYALSNAPYLSSAALHLLRSRRVPIILNQNGVFYPGWYPSGWERMNAAMANAYHLADHVFWQSDFCRRAADRFLGPRTGSGEILFNAIDTNHFAPRLAQAAGEGFKFLLTGKIDAHLAYRLESTIEGLALARRQGLDARLNIAGWVSDSARASAVRLADRLQVGRAVIFSGAYTQEGAPAVYQAADAYVMTKYLDPCPNTVLEAMSCGLPVLYSASGGVPELVGDNAGVGLPVPEEWNAIHVPEAKVICEGMLRVATNVNSMAAAARSRAVDNFEIGAWITRHRQVFEQLLRMDK